VPELAQSDTKGLPPRPTTAELIAAMQAPGPLRDQPAVRALLAHRDAERELRLVLDPGLTERKSGVKPPAMTNRIGAASRYLNEEGSSCGRPSSFRGAAAARAARAAARLTAVRLDRRSIQHPRCGWEHHSHALHDVRQSAFDRVSRPPIPGCFQGQHTCVRASPRAARQLTNPQLLRGGRHDRRPPRLTWPARDAVLPRRIDFGVRAVRAVEPELRRVAGLDVLDSEGAPAVPPRIALTAAFDADDPCRPGESGSYAVPHTSQDATKPGDELLTKGIVRATERRVNGPRRVPPLRRRGPNGEGTEQVAPLRMFNGRRADSVSDHRPAVRACSSIEGRFGRS
jgi:hypothetical protein